MSIEEWVKLASLDMLWQAAAQASVTDIYKYSIVMTEIDLRKAADDGV